MSASVVTLTTNRRGVAQITAASAPAKVVTLDPPKPKAKPIHVDELTALVSALQDADHLRFVQRTTRRVLRRTLAKISRDSKQLAERLNAGAEIVIRESGGQKE